MMTYFYLHQVWKRVSIFEQIPVLKEGVENKIFVSEIRSGFGEPGGTSPPNIPRSTPGSFNYAKKANASHATNQA